MPLFTRTSSFLLLPVTILVISIRGYSAEPIPFQDKFRRQQNPQYQGGPVFKPGERIRAAFATSQCTHALSIEVAEGHKNGVADDRHADTFQLLDIAPEDKQRLMDWRGLSFMGTIEVVEAIDKGFVISNMFEYKARLVAIEAPQAVVNPTVEMIRNALAGTELVLIGKVSNVVWSEENRLKDINHLVLETPKQKYTVTLWSGIPMLDSDLSDTIKNLRDHERLQVGDEVQLKVYKTEEGGIATHWCRSCNLEYPSPERKASYLAERQTGSNLIGEMKQAVANSDWPRFRKAHATFMKIAFTDTELVRQKKLWLKVPETERPIRLAKNRYKMTPIHDMFGMDADGMTTQEFLAFCDKWAEMKIPAQPTRSEKNGRDESYLFRILEDLDLKNEVNSIAQKGATTRLNYFEAKSNAGKVYADDVDFREYRNLERSLVYASLNPTAQSMEFLISVLDRLATLERRGWGYNGKFLFDAVKALEMAVANAFDDDDATAKDAVAQLMLQKQDIQKAYDTLQNIKLETPRGQVIIVGGPAAKPPTPRQLESEFSSELKTLGKIIGRL